MAEDTQKIKRQAVIDFSPKGEVINVTIVVDNEADTFMIRDRLASLALGKKDLMCLLAALFRRKGT